MSSFSFVLRSVQISKTRSLRKDTDYVTFTLQVGSGTPQSATQSLGDVGEGGYPLHLSFLNVVVNQTDTVKFNYLIVNSGSDMRPSDARATIEGVAVNLLIGAGILAGGTIAGSIGASILGVAAAFLGAELVKMIDADCDGTVAAEQVSLSYADLVAKTANGPFNQATQHPGTDSPDGCGANSMYVVLWEMMEAGNPATKTVPDLFQMSPTMAKNAVTAAGLVPKLMGPTTTKAWVFSQSPAGGTLADVGSTVTMVFKTGMMQ